MKWIYHNNHNNSARFVLGQRSKSSKKLLICFGINPSTATPEKLDRTLSRVKNESLERDFDGWIMLNLYPQRSTNPSDIHKILNDAIHKINLYHIKDVMGSGLKVTVWAAWGGSIQKRPFLKQCLRDIVTSLKPYSLKWVSMGNAKKHPHHPLYLKKGLPFDHFDIEAYLKEL